MISEIGLLSDFTMVIYIDFEDFEETNSKLLDCTSPQSPDDIFNFLWIFKIFVLHPLYLGESVFFFRKQLTSQNFKTFSPRNTRGKNPNPKQFENCSFKNIKIKGIYTCKFGLKPSPWEKVHFLELTDPMISKIYGTSAKGRFLWIYWKL